MGFPLKRGFSPGKHTVYVKPWIDTLWDSKETPRVLTINQSINIDRLGTSSMCELSHVTLCYLIGRIRDYVRF